MRARATLALLASCVVTATIAVCGGDSTGLRAADYARHFDAL